ncbi:MAG: shikimate dehydrogenase [Dermatophilaceae bacterium]
MPATPMKRAAVLGSPIAHSLSPTLHNAGYAARGLAEWSYGRREVTASELGEVVAALGDQWRGLSLTMPLKEAAFEVATTVSATAARAGAINTLTRRADGGWDATNTDVAGIVEALRPHLHDPSALPSATVVGAGATARSAVLALKALGCTHISVRARRPDAAEEVALWARETLGIETSEAGPISGLGPGERLVVSTVPPAASLLVAAALSATGRPGELDAPVLLDVVYADWPTPLAREAARLGWTVVSGLDMLVHQAAAQFELFTGVPAPVEAMMDAGRAALA